MAARKQHLTPQPHSTSPSSLAGSGIVPRLLRRSDAAQYLAVSAPTFDSYRAQGYIRQVLMPDTRGAGRLRTPLFDRADFDAFIDRMKVTGGVS
jgi:hypothetical protein